MHSPTLPAPSALGRRAAALALAAALGLAGAGCEREAPSGQDEAAATEEVPPPPVEAVAARRGALPLRERLSGIVRASNQVTIRAEVEAVVTEVLVRSGEAVEKGQVLVRLEDDTLRHQLAQAEATVRLQEAAARSARARVGELESQVKRTRRLAEDALASPLEIEVLEAQLEAARADAEQAAARVELAQATVDERRSAVARTVVRAPVAGRVGLRRAEVGMLADRSTALFVLGALDRVVVEVPLTEGMLAYVAEGQTVRIASPVLGEGEVVTATLSRISPFLAPGSLSTTAEIDVSNAEGRLYPGMFVTVDVLYDQRQATLLPVSALWEDPITGARSVYVLETDTLRLPDDGDPVLSDEAHPVERRDVTILAEGDATVGVDGVAEGEWVVTIGQHLLRREGAAPLARVRPTSWERVLDLQSRPREDVLRDFLAKQRRVAAEQGARPPTTDAYLGKDGADAEAAAPPAEETPADDAGRAPAGAGS